MALGMPDARLAGGGCVELVGVCWQMIDAHPAQIGRNITEPLTIRRPARFKGQFLVIDKGRKGFTAGDIEQPQPGGTEHRRRKLRGIAAAKGESTPIGCPGDAVTDGIRTGQ